MMNRRNLRIQVMNALYSMEMCLRANISLSIDFLCDLSRPDFDAQEILEPEAQLEIERDLKEEFLHSFAVERGQKKQSVSSNPILEKARQRNRELISRDFQNIEKLLSKNVNVIRPICMEHFGLICSLSSYLQNYYGNEGKKDKMVLNRISSNKFIQIIQENVELQKTILAKPRRYLQEEPEFINILFNKEIKKKPFYNRYITQEECSYDDDNQFVIDLFRDGIFTSSLCASFFESLDLNWFENRSIVHALIKKSIKSVPSNCDKDYSLVPLPENWEEEHLFVTKLYRITFQEEQYFESLISGKSLNWKPERISSLDRILIKMALTEFLYFGNIPPKVTIDEYIEISKYYSTPKSHEFINGILNSLYIDLSRSKQINKSGRGLVN